MTTNNINLPAIPYLHAFNYKKYYVCKDKDNSQKYHLYLFKYEPKVMDKINIAKTDYICGRQQYGDAIIFGMYTYEIGQEKWTHRSDTTLSQKFSDFEETLLFNNFTIKFTDKHFETNPFPNDQVIPEAKLQLPGIPYEHNYQFKHYYITQDKQKIEIYHLFLFQYEPVIISVDHNGILRHCNQYNSTFTINVYDFEIGKKEWQKKSTHGNYVQDYMDFKDALLFNNFDIEIGNEYFPNSPLPDDQLIPAVAVLFPPVLPVDGRTDQFKHYLMLQDTSQLEKYTLYVFEAEPIYYALQGPVNSRSIEYKDKAGRSLDTYVYQYSLGDTNWSFINNWNGTSFYVEKVNRSAVYNNFEIKIFDPEASASPLSRSSDGMYICEADSRAYEDDGVSTAPTTGWVKTTNGTFYYNNGKPHREWLELNGKTYYMDGEKKWARVENDFKTIRASKYYFGKNGVMVSGSGHEINGDIYNFDVYGRLLSKGPEGVKYEVYTLLFKSDVLDSNNDTIVELKRDDEVKVILPEETKPGKIETLIKILHNENIRWIAKGDLKKKEDKPGGITVPHLSFEFKHMAICTDGYDDSYRTSSYRQSLACFNVDEEDPTTPSATKVPYIVLAQNHPNVSELYRDYAVIIDHHTGKYVYAIVADIGPNDEYREISIKAAWDLGFNTDGTWGPNYTGHEDDNARFEFIVFTGTSTLGYYAKENEILQAIKEEAPKYYPQR